MTTGLLTNYLGQGPLADRPAIPEIFPDSLALYRDETGDVSVWDSDNDAWVSLIPEQEPFPDLSGFITEAPNDAFLYVRGQKQWIVLPPYPEAGIGEAPEDGNQYVRKDGAWEAFELPPIPDAGIPEAPNDGKLYGRKNESWVEVVIPEGGSGGIEEAPEDGKQYARKNAAWAEVVSSGGGGSDTINVIPNPALFTLVGLNGGPAPTLTVDAAGMHIRSSDRVGASLAYIALPAGDFQFDVGVAVDTAVGLNAVPRWGVYNSGSNDAYCGTIYFESPPVQIRRFGLAGGYNSDKKQPTGQLKQYWRFKRVGGATFCYGSKDGVDYVLVDEQNNNSFDRMVLAISNDTNPCAFCIYHFAKSW